MNRNIATLLATVLLLAPLTLAASSWPDARGWPEYGGSLARTGSSPLAGPTVKTQAFTPATLAGASFTAPVADLDGNLYVGDDTGVVSKFRPNLERVWTSPNLGGALRASMALAPNRTVFAAPVGGDLIALNGTTGTILWRTNVHNTAPASEYVLTAAPGVHPNGFVVQPSMDGNVYAINFDGKVRWGPVVAATDKCVAAPAIMTNGMIYLGCQDGKLRAIKADGTVAWSLPLQSTSGGEHLNEQQVAAPSLATDGTIYVTTRVARSISGSVYAVKDEGTSGTIKWRTPLNEKITSPVTVAADGSLYIGDLSGDVFRLNAQGVIQWTFSPADDDPDVYKDAEVKAQTGTLAESLAVAELSIADAAGHLYVTHWHVDLSKGFPPQESFKSPFYALNTADGTMVWRELFPKTMRSGLLGPTTSTDAQGRTVGLLYLAGDDGKLYAIGTGTPPAPTTSPTPTTTTPSPTTSLPNQASSTPSKEDTPDVPGIVLLAVVAVAVAFLRRRA